MSAPALLTGLLFDRRSLALARVGAAIGLIACLQHRVFDLEIASSFEVEVIDS